MRSVKYFEEALTVFNTALEIYAQDANALFGRGCTYKSLGLYEDALQDFNSVLKLYPNNALALTERGRTLRTLIRYEEALSDFNSLLKMSSRYKHLALKEKGATLHTVGRYQEAIDAFTEALVVEPTCTQCWSLLMNISGSLKNKTLLQEALANFTHFIELYPTKAEPLIARSEIYKLMGRHEEALADCDHAIEIDQSREKSLYNEKGLLYSYTHRYAEAIKCYERVLTKEENNYYLLYNIAVVMTRWKGFSNAQEYIDVARSALLAVDDPDDHKAVLYGLGGLEALIGNFDQALEYLQQSQSTYWARDDIAWLDLRTDPRFQLLVFDIKKDS